LIQQNYQINYFFYFKFLHVKQLWRNPQPASNIAQKSSLPQSLLVVVVLSGFAATTSKQKINSPYQISPNFTHQIITVL
jgi:hypothetical protein